MLHRSFRVRGRLGLVTVVLGFTACKTEDEGESDSVANIESSEGSTLTTGSAESDSATATTSTTEVGSETTESSDSSSSSDSPCQAPDMECDGVCIDPLTDDQHCGECGKTCAVVLDSGGCSNGSCAPVWSDCIDSSTLVLCPQVCGSQGFAGCSTAACGDDDMSIWWFGAESTCEAGTFSPEAEANACETEPNGMNSYFYRCCCDQG